MTYRPRIDESVVSKGGSWLGIDAIKLGLIDGVMHSDAYLRTLITEQSANIYVIKPLKKVRSTGIFAKVFGNREDSFLSMISEVVMRKFPVLASLQDALQTFLL